MFCEYADEQNREPVANPRRRKPTRGEADSPWWYKNNRLQKMEPIVFFRIRGESNRKGRKREFSLKEESTRKPEGFRESERSERVRFPLVVQIILKK